MRLVFFLFCSFFASSQEQNIFYKDADIKTFAQDIALLTDKTIILDPRVKGVISVYSDASIDSETIWEIFLSTMEVQGYTVQKMAIYIQLYHLKKVSKTLVKTSFCQDLLPQR